MKNYKLDPYEQDLEDHADELKSVPNVKEEMKRLQEYAKYSVEKKQSITLRVPYKVIENFKTLAIADGLPYQTLMNSVLHKYTVSRLKKKKPKKS